MTRKGERWRPYDVAGAITRAAECRAARERVGLTRDQLAALAGVTERSAGRWEDADGAGNCPDDVLELLGDLLDRQAALAYRAGDLARALLDGARADGPAVSDFRSVSAPPPGALCTAPGGAGEVNRAVEGGWVQASPETPKKASLEVDFDARGGGGRGEGDLDSRFVRLDADSMPWATLLYYPSRRCYAECHANDSTFYGVANANARAIAQELERLGFGIEWRYATPELVDGFPFDYV